jgi:peroxiredoxin
MPDLRCLFTMTMFGLTIGVMEVRADHPEPGHSAIADVFDEGPRQAAYLMGGTGDVHFPVTTAVPEAQTFFNQGIGQLHGFWYFEAERSFRQAAMLDPECAMAYWGMAYANIENRSRAAKFVAKATEKRGTASRREQLYIDAFAGYLKDDKRADADRRKAYIRDVEKVLLEFPDDQEAKALLAVFLYQSKDKGVPISSYFAVDALLSEIFDKNPMHPSHHFRIHLWNNHDDKKALESAARCGQAAPGIAHMWHMPGHTYSSLKRWADATWQQEASSRVDHAHMIRDRVLPDQIHNYAHNQEWLIRNLIFEGRIYAALDLAKNLCELPRHPKFNTLTKGSAKFGRERLLQVLDSFELWDETVSLAQSMYLPASDDPLEEVKRLRLLGRAYFHRGETVLLAERLRELEAIAAKLEEKAQAEATKAEQKARSAKQSEEEVAKAKDKKLKQSRDNGKPVELARAELSGLLLLTQSETDMAVEELAKATDLSKVRTANYQFLTDQVEKSRETLAAASKGDDRQVLPLVAQVDLLLRLDKADEARTTFEKLREIASAADLDSPPLARLTTLAQELGWPADWRKPATPSTDVGVRPSLDLLGPLRWSPSLAPEWNLPQPNHQSLSLSSYRGRSVVVLFYLGAGCLHCVEQLQKFAPRVGDFDQAGIAVVAISREDLSSLTMAMTNFSKDGQFPIPLAADPELQVFRAYRAYDDFEKQPLHGVFFIDPTGCVRWQDISAEPFMDVNFVLSEAKRLQAIGPVRDKTSSPPTSTEVSRSSLR